MSKIVLTNFKREEIMAQKAARKPKVRNLYPHCLIEKTLKSEPAQKAYKRYYDITATELFKLAFNVRILATEEIANEYNEYVQSEIDAVLEVFKNEKNRLHKLMKKNGILPGMTFPKAITVQAKVSSPSAAKLLSVICELDGVVEAYTSLWVHGVINDKQYSDGTLAYRQRVIKMTGRLRSKWYDFRKGMEKNGVTPADTDLAQEEDTNAVATDQDTTVDDTPEKLAVNK